MAEVFDVWGNVEVCSQYEKFHHTGVARLSIRYAKTPETVVFYLFETTAKEKFETALQNLLAQVQEDIRADEAEAVGRAIGVGEQRANAD